jgi:hypothetical protein
MNPEINLLKLMVKGAYDLQALRMQCGLRLCANFRAKLKDNEPTAQDEEAEEGLSEEAEKIIDLLKEDYRRLCDGIAKNRTLPTEKGFHGTELISLFSELVLVDQYVQLEQQETKQFRQMTATLEKIPIFTEYLTHQRGIGPAMAGVLITTLDPAKARHISSFWKYAGLDVGPDNRGRSRRAEHLVERSYLDKNGKPATRMGVTYNPWLKTKLFTLAGSFMRSQSPWREAYDGYKHRLVSDPTRSKIEVKEWKKLHAAGDETQNLWTPGRIDMAAKRYMLKMILADLWVKWRTIEGLPVTPTYHEAKLGHQHKAA